MSKNKEAADYINVVIATIEKFEKERSAPIGLSKLKKILRKEKLVPVELIDKVIEEAHQRGRITFGKQFISVNPPGTPQHEIKPVIVIRDENPFTQNVSS